MMYFPYRSSLEGPEVLVVVIAYQMVAVVAAKLMP